MSRTMVPNSLYPGITLCWYGTRIARVFITSAEYKYYSIAPKADISDECINRMKGLPVIHTLGGIFIDIMVAECQPGIHTRIITARKR